MDSFFHFDSAYRILNDQHPFKDFWVVSGPVVDYLQSIFFLLFGVSWKSYILHSSLFNSFLTISTFFVLYKYKLDLNFCFLYSLLFSILAYPSSGTLFPDHHSSFFSLLAVYSFLLAIITQRNLYWILLPIFFFLAFLSKQVPAAYVILSLFCITILYCFKKKNFQSIKYILITSFFIIFFIIIFFKINGIKIYDFFNQYIFYSQSIGAGRLENFNFTFQGVINHFKFIYLAFIPLFYFNLKKIIYLKNYNRENNFYVFFALLFLMISLVMHQLLTKNQTFIFFLIPLLTAFSHLSINYSKLKSKKIVYLIFLIICLFATFKYHLRFNEDRKFHELAGANLDKAVDATKINKKLLGLKWITPQYPDDPEKEIALINKLKLHLSEDSRKKMVLSNYPFFSTILNENLSSPFRIYTGDGTSQPLKGDKYEKDYEQLILNLIKKNEVSVVYIISPVKSNIKDYLNQLCFTENLIFEELKSYEIKKCD